MYVVETQVARIDFAQERVEDADLDDAGRSKRLVGVQHDLFTCVEIHHRCAAAAGHPVDLIAQPQDKATSPH